jgi:hypothetical protein
MTIHAATILYDLLEDYEYFKSEADKVDRKTNPLLYKRMARASILSFFNYFDGVLNRWIASLDPQFNLEISTGAKLGRIRKEIRAMGQRPDFAETQYLKGIRNKIVHLKVGDDDTLITEELLSGRFFRDAKELHNWLKIAGHRLGLALHADPKEMMKPYLDSLGSDRNSSATPLSEEDEELVHLAEMTFLEYDAREAADGKS